MKICAAALLVGLPLLAQASYYEGSSDGISGLPLELEERVIEGDRLARSLQGAWEGAFCSSVCTTAQPCYADPTCLVGEESLGCNAAGAGQACRFCEFGEFADIVCVKPQQQADDSTDSGAPTAGTTAASADPIATPGTAAPIPQHAWSSYYGYCDPSCTHEAPCFDDTACSRVDLGFHQPGFVVNTNVIGGNVAGCGAFADYSCRSCAIDTGVECGCNGATKDVIAKINAGGPDGYRAAMRERGDYADFVGATQWKFSTPEDPGLSGTQLVELCKTDPTGVVNFFAFTDTPSWSPRYDANAATGTAEAVCMKGMDGGVGPLGAGFMGVWFEEPAGVQTNSQCGVASVTCDDIRMPNVLTDYNWATELSQTSPGTVTQESSTGLWLSYAANFFRGVGFENVRPNSLANYSFSVIKKGTCLLADGRKVAFEFVKDGCDVEYQQRYEGRGSQDDPENPLCIPGTDEILPYTVKFI